MELVGATGLRHVDHLVLLQCIGPFEGLPTDVTQVWAHLRSVDITLVSVKVDSALKSLRTLRALKTIRTSHRRIVGVTTMSQQVACEVVTVG